MHRERILTPTKFFGGQIELMVSFLKKLGRIWQLSFLTVMACAAVSSRSQVSDMQTSQLCPQCPDATQPDLQLFQHQGQALFLTGVNLGNVQLLPFDGNPYGYSAAELKVKLKEAFAALHAAGANSFRVWLHIDGSRSPTFGAGSQGLVTGLPADLVSDLQWLLATAYRDYGLLANITLWSHDVLAVRRGFDIAARDRALRLFNDPTAMQAYIDKALTPLVQAMAAPIPRAEGSTQMSAATYRDAILGWEVLNEPEGASRYFRLYLNYQYNMTYGDYLWRREALPYLGQRSRTDAAQDDGSSSWTPVHFRGWYFADDNHNFNLYLYKDFSDLFPSEWDFLKKAIVDDKTLATVDIAHENITKFISVLAAAIHRLDPGAKVSAGAHSMPYNTDIPMPNLNEGPVPHNYYADDYLTRAGGEAGGALDFYQVHGYPWWSSGEKDMMTNMFRHEKRHWQVDKPVVIGEHWNIVATPDTPLSAQHYVQAHDSGYAGIWAWAYFQTREDRGDGAASARRRLEIHENWPIYQQVLQSLPARLRYPVAVKTKAVQQSKVQ